MSYIETTISDTTISDEAIWDVKAGSHFGIVCFKIHTPVYSSDLMRHYLSYLLSPLLNCNILCLWGYRL